MKMAYACLVSEACLPLLGLGGWENLIVIIPR